MSKICTKCGIEKSENDYWIGSYYCKDCCRKVATEYRRKKGVLPKPCSSYVIPDKKVCCRCKKEKDKLEFGTVTNSSNTYLRSYCKQCDKEKATEYARNKGVMPIHCRPVEELPKSKVCTRCRIEKPQDKFRLRSQKGKTGVIYWLSPPCLECEAKAQRERTREQRKTKEGREYHNNKAKEYYHKHKPVMKVRAKKYRGSKKAKELRKKYVLKNKDKIYKQEVVTKKRYHEKNRDKITDKYCANQLRQQGRKVTPENIEIKRGEILIDRLAKKITGVQKPTGILKVCTHCKKEKDEIEFYPQKRRSGKIGRCAICKVCSSEKGHEYRKKIKNGSKRSGANS